MRSLILILVLAGSIQAQYCNSPYCAMCNRIRAQLRMEQQPQIDSTPYQMVDAMLKIANPRKSEVLYDLGCGDGRIVIAAAKQYGCKAVGIEIDKDVAAIAKKKVREAGVDHLVTIIVGDATKIPLDGVDVITMYLYQDTMNQLQPQMFNANRIVSYLHAIPGVRNRVWITQQKKIYMWQSPSFRFM